VTEAATPSKTGNAARNTGGPGTGGPGAALGAFARGLRDLPPEATAIAQRNILETIVLGLAGMGEDGVGDIARLARSEHAAGPATVWDGGPGLAPGGAALVNGVAAAALDFDSLFRTVHADSVIVPVVLAVGEAVNASGRDVLLAYAAGVEIMARLSEASIPPQRGWTQTAVFGVFGAAAASARLLGLDEDAFGHALGIGLSLAAGSQQANVEKVLTKRLQPALAARNGVFAAHAAKSGVTAPAEWLEGRAGIWALYQAGDPKRLLAGLGERFLFTETLLKKYPVCSCSHAAIDALAAIIEQYDLTADAMASVTVTLTPFMNHMVGGAFAPESNPVVTAQFSVQYALACIALRGRVSLKDLALDAIADPAIARFCDRIEVVVDEAETGELTPARVEVRAGGQVFVEQVDAMPGSAEAPLSAAEQEAKLADCLDRVPGWSDGARRARLMETVRRLPDLPKIAELTALLR